MVVDVSVRHDAGDVGEECHPGVLRLFVPHVMGLQEGSDCVEKDVGHDAKVIGRNPHVTVETSQTQQDQLGLSSE